MNRVIITIIFFLTASQVLAQKDWDIYTFGNICSFRIPPTMELRDTISRSGISLNKTVNQVSIALGEIPADREIKFQPKGINSSNKEEVAKATTIYSRILIADFNGNFPTQRDVENATNEDIQKINATFRNQAIQSFSYLYPKEKIVWLPLTRVKIGGKYSLISRYKRPSPKGGFVYVREYKFFLTTHLLRIIVSYRENESHLWKADLDKFISTLSFN